MGIIIRNFVSFDTFYCWCIQFYHLCSFSPSTSYSGPTHPSAVPFSHPAHHPGNFLTPGSHIGKNSPVISVELKFMNSLLIGMFNTSFFRLIAVRVLTLEYRYLQYICYTKFTSNKQTTLCTLLCRVCILH